MKKGKQFLVILIALLLLPGVSILADDSEPKFSWPMEITSDEGFVTTLYQPQLESFEGDILEGRMAVTITPPEKEMIFGALWFKARLSTDMENRTVLLQKMDIVKTHFPDIVDEEKTSSFTKLLSAEMESWNLEMSLDRILASIAEVENLKGLSDDINNDPPTIYFRTAPAILLIIDGEPVLKEDEETKVEYVVNTPFFMVKDPRKEKYYVKGGPFWYESKEMLKGWGETKKVPSKVEKFAEKYVEEEEPDSVAQSYTEAPELIVETKAAELVMVDGDIDYKPIEGTSLLFVSNSESDIIMDINSQNHYVLLAGRWFHSKSLMDGDWKFSEPEDLPEDFDKIPDDSEMADVRPSIPGTTEAQTALLEQSIPQTATIDRAEAKTSVTYDGNPQFEDIEGTSVAYAVNTDKTVLLINSVYYVVEDAVWFMSDKPTGPWEVCVIRPDEVDQIPPEAPVYNVKYTYIYESTPEVVYVGYLPGYTHSYVYGGVVVYGTGYHYQPWYGAYYYPRPVTWGYGVHYNPYSGWGFSFGISYGWIGWGFHPYRRAYWGPRGFHHGYRHGYNRGYRHGARHGYRAGYRAGQRNSHRNVYNNRNSGVRQSANRNPGANNVNNKARASGKANNMYSDRNGNVYQRNQNGGFDQKSNRSGQQAGQQPSQRPSTTQPSTGQQPSQRPSTTQPSTGQQPSQRPSTTQPSTGQQPSQRPSTTQPSTGQQQRQSQPSQSNRSMEQSYQNRSQGSQNYNRSQQQRSSSPSRSSGGGSRGGGGGGRRR